MHLEGRSCLAGRHTFVARRFSWRIRSRWPPSVAASLGAVSRRGLSDRSKIVSARLEKPPRMALGPGVREREGRHVSNRRDELLDLGHPDRLTLGPGRNLADFVRESVKILLADIFDEQRARVGLGLHARLPKAFRNPGDAPSLGHVVQQHVTGLRACFRDGGVLLHLEPDHGEHAVRSRCSEVGNDSPPRRLPSILPSAGDCPPSSDRRPPSRRRAAHPRTGCPSCTA